MPVEMRLPLARNLEGEPLEFDVLLLAGARQLMVLVVLVNQILHNRESLPGRRSEFASDENHDQALPNGEIVVMVVDDGGDAAVGIDLQVFRSLVFLLAEIEVHRFVRQPKFFKNYGDFPENRIELRWWECIEGKEACHPLGPEPWVYRVNCFP